jgi:hypothetical protein
MAKVPLPDRGQPLDLAYIYQLAQAINNISDELSPSTGNYTTVSIGGTQERKVRTSDARIVGKIKTVDNGLATAGDVPFYVDYSDFAYAPVVTATAKASGDTGSDASKDVAVILTSVTTTRADGIVRFGTNGAASVDIHLLAIGIPT